MSLRSRHPRRLLAVVLIAACASTGISGAQEHAGDQVGSLQASSRLMVKVMIVASDLSLKPVPKWSLRLEPLDGGGEGHRVVTGFSGEVEVEVAAGHYRVVSQEPLSFEGKLFSWELEVEARVGETITVELSNDNASIQTATAIVPARELDEGEIYRRFTGSVFKVRAEGGHGSGFLADKAGLVVTNHHVIAGSEYLAVKLDDRHKVEARLVAADEIHDLAVLQVHPDAVASRTVLTLANDAPDAPSVAAGDRVLAIGSPLATETILTSGLVSKVEKGALYSDVNINPGNSGGPLFNMTGEVVGVNTFGLFAAAGPGVSGIVRIHLAVPLLAEARAKIAEGEIPSPRLLPIESEFRFPPDVLREMALARDLNVRQYHVEAGKIDVQVITPVVIASLQVEGEKAADKRRRKRTKGKQGVTAYTPGDDFYEWRRYAGDYRPVVVVQAIPEIRMTNGSIWATALLGPNVPKKYRFKTDFDRMELTRNGDVVEPLHPGRVAQSVNLEAGLDRMDDVGYFGAYEYPPEAFAPGAQVVLKVWRQGNPEPNVNVLDPVLLQRIWSDFSPYAASLEGAGDGDSSE